jgi:hypothetical protein
VGVGENGGASIDVGGRTRSRSAEAGEFRVSGLDSALGGPRATRGRRGIGFFGQSPAVRATVTFAGVPRVRQRAAAVERGEGRAGLWLHPDPAKALPDGLRWQKLDLEVTRPR